MLKIEWNSFKKNPNNLPPVQKTVWLETIYGLFRGRRFNNDNISFHIEGPCGMESIKFENIIAWHEPYELSFIQPERSKREDSQQCEMRCSEHCGNTVREVQ